MTHTNPEFLYELKIGVSALMRACYEVIGACNQIEHSIRLLDKDIPEFKHKDYGVIATVDKTTGECKMENMKDGGPFTPSTKPRDTKGDPLAELAAQMNPQDREKLIAAMEGKK